MQYRERLDDVIAEQFAMLENQLSVAPSPEGKMLTRERLSFWGLRKDSAVHQQVTSPESGPPSGALVYEGPPRVLEIGCGDGSWCFKLKEEQPEWIVEGVDDTDHVIFANPKSLEVC